jgi:hypothetical protein
MVGAEPRQRVLVEADEVGVLDDDAAGIGPLQPGHDHQQRRLAGAGRADEADRLAAVDIQRDAAQDVDAGGAAAEAEIDVRQRDRGLAQHLALAHR